MDEAARHVAALVDAAVADGSIPGAVVVTGVGPDRPGHTHIAGVTAVGGDPIDATTLFDLASLTKVMATVPVVLRLAELGALSVDDPVVRFLPEVGTGAAAKAEITLRHLLTHTAGLPAGRRYYLEADDPAEIRRRVRAEPLVAPPGTAMCYSDVGFVLLGDVVEVAGGAPLDRLAAELVHRPLGLTARVRPDDPESCAATEVLPGGVVKRGVVHDENAEALGGVAGHAGLFATAADVAAYARAWLTEETPILTAASRTEALRCHTTGLGGRRGLGWVLRGDTWDHMGTAWPQAGAGHTGFTGTSIGLDPVSGLWVVLLTNAVHAGRPNRAVIALRRAVHDAVAANAPARIPAPRRSPESGRRDTPKGRVSEEIGRGKPAA